MLKRIYLLIQILMNGIVFLLSKMCKGNPMFTHLTWEGHSLHERRVGAFGSALFWGVGGETVVNQEGRRHGFRDCSLGKDVKGRPRASAVQQAPRPLCCAEVHRAGGGEVVVT